MKKSERGRDKGQGSGYDTGQGQGFGFGGGRGRNKGGSYGIGGFCICAKCGEKIPHKRGLECTSLKCPKCGHTMIREEIVQDRI